MRPPLLQPGGLRCRFCAEGGSPCHGYHRPVQLTSAQAPSSRLGWHVTAGVRGRAGPGSADCTSQGGGPVFPNPSRAQTGGRLEHRANLTRTPPCPLRVPPVGRRMVTCPREEGHGMENNGAASPGRLPGGGGLLPRELGAAPTQRYSAVVTRPRSACPTPGEPDEAPERGAGTLQPLHDPDAGAELAGRGPARAPPGRAAAPARESAGGEDARRAGLAGASARVSACAQRRPRPAPTRYAQGKVLLWAFDATKSTKR